VGCKILFTEDALVGGVDQFLEAGQAHSAANGMAVEEEDWRPVCAQPVPFLAIGIHLRFEPMAVQVFYEARYVQVQLSGPAYPEVETGGTQQLQNRLQRELAAAHKIAVTH